MQYSVVIPVHNGENTIKRAIDSALNQSLQPEYLIVFDNASTDGTSEIVHRLGRKNNKIRVIQSAEKLSPLESFRSSIANVEGLFIWLAGDDILLPHAIHDLWQSRCMDECTHTMGHRAVFFDTQLKLVLGKDFTNIIRAKSPLTKFLEFPADNSIFYSLTDAGHARMILPKSEMYAWDWVYSSRLLVEPFHYQNVKVGLMRERSPRLTYQSQAQKSMLAIDKVFPLRRASKEFLKIPAARNRESIINIAILNLYVALMFGTFSINDTSLALRILRRANSGASLLLNSAIEFLTRLLRGVFLTIRPFLSLDKRTYLAKKLKLPKPISGFISTRFANNHLNEMTGLKGLETSSLDSANIPPFSKTGKKIALNPVEFNTFADLVSLSKFLSSRSNLEIEVEQNFRSENQARIYNALVKNGLISNIRIVKKESSMANRKCRQLNIDGVNTFGLIEWKNNFNKTSVSAVRRTGGKQKVSRKILVCLPEVPVPTRDSGSNDIIYYLLLLTNLGHDVTVCIPHKSVDQNSLRLLESICKVNLYTEVTPVFEKIVVYGPYAFQLFSGLNFYQDYIYIMIDAVFRRFRQDKTATNLSDRAILEFERRAILGSRVSFAISQKDINACNEEFPNSKFEHFPIIRNFEMDRIKRIKNPERILFVGSMNHTPNSEALGFILKELAPRINELHPNLIFTIVGKGSEEFEVFSKNVQTLGMLSSLDQVYSESFVSLAPMSIAAGINGKVIESINFGVFSLVSPMVSANLSESMRKCSVVCASAEEYVEAISSFYLQRRIISESLRLAVAKEINGRLNAIVLRKYLQ